MNVKNTTRPDAVVLYFGHNNFWTSALQKITRKSPVLLDFARRNAEMIGHRLDISTGLCEVYLLSKQTPP